MSKFEIIISCLVLFSLSLIGCQKPNKGYEGKPFEDEKYKGGAQQIPGNVEAEYFDFGGEGLAFHDSDSVNSGSGGLNPDDGSYLHSFRIKEAPDISYTKPDGIDEHPYNFTDPEMGKLYLGWTNPGEWTRYTVEVAESGVYQLGLMYTSHEGGKIGITINEEEMVGPYEVESTFVEADTVAWRQWHHWRFDDNLGEITLKKGKQILTLHTIENGQMNYDYLSFKLKEQAISR